MDDDQIDFSALDPKRDAVRFERMVALVVAGARSAAAASPRLVYQLVAWGRAAVAASVLLAAAAWLPALFKGGPSLAPALRGSDPVELVFQWARAGKVPSGVDPVDALGDLDAR